VKHKTWKWDKKGPLQGNRLGNLPTHRVSIYIAFLLLLLLILFLSFFFFFFLVYLGFVVADVRIYLDYPEIRNLMRIVIAFIKIVLS
jgi:hypothetical protein